MRAAPHWLQRVCRFMCALYPAESAASARADAQQNQGVRRAPPLHASKEAPSERPAAISSCKASAARCCTSASLSRPPAAPPPRAGGRKTKSEASCERGTDRRLCRGGAAKKNWASRSASASPSKPGRLPGSRSERAISRSGTSGEASRRRRSRDGRSESGASQPACGSRARSSRDRPRRSACASPTRAAARSDSLGRSTQSQLSTRSRVQSSLASTRTAHKSSAGSALTAAAPVRYVFLVRRSVA
mmetsp:Transcript_48025/g.155318  ORF Transcript_48025/g.155318 Transcript_48025/m.155318 type:complete len:246 (-) Transcript_48025:418-1155(-)